MRVLVLTNNSVSVPLIKWLGDREEVTVREEKITASELKAMRPDRVVSYAYRHILAQQVIDILPGNFINLHIALLPYNRGADPNAWSFLDGTPSGVTIHLIDSGIDTGPILLQKAVAFDEARDTLAGSYLALHAEIQHLFIENWAAIRDGAIAPKPQAPGGSYHRSEELAALKERLVGAEGWNVPIRLFRERYRQLLRQAS